MRSDWPANLAKRFFAPAIAVRHEAFELTKPLGSTESMRIGFAADFHAGPTAAT